MADHGLAGFLKWRWKTRLGGMGLWELMKVFQNRSGKEYGFSAGEVAPCVCALTVFHVLLLPSLTPPPQPPRNPGHHAGGSGSVLLWP